MRIVFFGTPGISLPSLAALAGEHEIRSVVCPPDKPRGRGRVLSGCPVKEWADAHGVPAHQPVKLNDGSFTAWLREKQPDLCVVVAYGRILRDEILAIPRHGFLNVHPSLLPLYRGPSPIQTAIWNGDAMTGVSIMRLSAAMDAGDILLQETHPIAPDQTADGLTVELGDLGARMLLEGVRLIAQGRAVFTPQDDAKATLCHIWEKDRGVMDWRRTARELACQVRACLPWPMAQTVFGGQPLLIHETVACEGEAASEPGVIARADKDMIIVNTGLGLLGLTRVQPPGKNPMSVREFQCGRKVHPGDQLGTTSYAR